MILTDFDQEAYDRMVRKDAYDECALNMISKYIGKGHTVADAAATFDMSVSEIDALMKAEALK